MAERPVECSQCKKQIDLIYKEISGGSIVTSQMCADCPLLQQKLHGQIDKEKGACRFCCGSCGTALDNVQMGHPLGCANCYEVFAEVLCVSPHVGKQPNMATSVSLSARLIALHEALNEALKKENYEQAAWLRDQIKALTNG